MIGASDVQQSRTAGKRLDRTIWLHTFVNLKTLGCSSLFRFYFYFALFTFMNTFMNILKGGVELQDPEAIYSHEFQNGCTAETG